MRGLVVGWNYSVVWICLCSVCRFLVNVLILVVSFLVVIGLVVRFVVNFVVLIGVIVVLFVVLVISLCGSLLWLVFSFFSRFGEMVRWL